MSRSRSRDKDVDEETDVSFRGRSRIRDTTARSRSRSRKDGFANRVFQSRTKDKFMVEISLIGDNEDSVEGDEGSYTFVIQSDYQKDPDGTHTTPLSQLLNREINNMNESEPTEIGFISDKDLKTNSAKVKTFFGRDTFKKKYYRISIRPKSGNKRDLENITSYDVLKNIPREFTDRSILKPFIIDRTPRTDGASGGKTKTKRSKSTKKTRRNKKR